MSCFMYMCMFQEQYIYLHEALAEALLFGTELVHARQFESVYKFMTEIQNEHQKIRLMEQFDVNVFYYVLVVLFL